MLILSFNHKKELTEILVNKKLLFLFLILSINHCSFSKNSSFWNPVNIEKDDNKKELFKKVEITNFEINNDLEITSELSSTDMYCAYGLKKKAESLTFSRVCGLGVSKKVGAGDGLRV